MNAAATPQGAPDLGLSKLSLGKILTVCPRCKHTAFVPPPAEGEEENFNNAGRLVERALLCLSMGFFVGFTVFSLLRSILAR